MAEESRSSVSAPGGVVSRLGAGLRIKGEVSGTDHLVVDGLIEGTIQMQGHRLTVGHGAKVMADVLAAEIVVFGEVKGNLQADDRIEIKKDGAVVGDLLTSRIMIEDGAYFKGAIEIDRRPVIAEQQSEQRPEQRPERAMREPEAKVTTIPMGGTPTLHLPTYGDKAV